MNIAIGTPIHDSKEYSTYLWLDSIKAIDWPKMPIFISDNSDTPEFCNRVMRYCKKIGLDAEIGYISGMIGKESEARRVPSREWFRNKILKTNADVWLSWECDVLVEPESLKIVTKYLSDVDIITHSYPDRNNPGDLTGGIGFALIKREILEKYSFTTGGGYAQCDPDRPGCWYSGDSWFIIRAIRDGYKTADFGNLIKIQHLGG